MAYNLLSLQTAVQDDLGDTAFNTTRITRYLNYGQQAIFNTHMFRFCEKSVSGALTIGKYTYNQQDDHQSTIGGILYNPTSTSSQLVLDEDNYLAHREFFDRFPAPELQTNNMPSYWTEFGNQIYFNCPVDVAYTFKQRYFCVPVDITDVVAPTVPVSFRELLELYADFRSEKYRGNHDIAGTYKQAFDDELENMVLRYAEATQLGPVVMGSNRIRINES